MTQGDMDFAIKLSGHDLKMAEFTFAGAGIAYDSILLMVTKKTIKAKSMTKIGEQMHILLIDNYDSFTYNSASIYWNFS